MTAQASEAARQLAAGPADAFEQDRALAAQLNDCQDRLRAGNDRLWSGLHPDALGLVYDDTAGGGVGQGSSAVAGQLVDAVRSGLPTAEVEASVLPGLQEAHWAIHRAFCDYQQISEDRRHLAAAAAAMSCEAGYPNAPFVAGVATTSMLPLRAGVDSKQKSERRAIGRPSWLLIRDWGSLARSVRIARASAKMCGHPVCDGGNDAFVMLASSSCARRRWTLVDRV